MKAKSPHIDAPAILSAAINHMNERAANYDTPSGERSMSLTVTVTELLMPGPLTEAKGWLMMDVLKTVRALTALQHGKLHQDSIEDKVAYAALFGEAVARQVETQTKE